MDSPNRRRRAILHLTAGLAGALLVVAPLPFASVAPEALTILRLAVFALLLLGAAARNGDLSPSALSAAGALVAVAGLGVLQAVAWPAGVARLLSPSHAALAGSAASLATGEPPGGVSLSLAPAVTISTALTFAAAAAALLVGTIAGSHRPGRRVMAGCLVASGLFQVLYGARVWMGDGRIWGRLTAGDATRLRGTYINADHLALFLEMALAVLLAAAWWGLRRGRRQVILEYRLLLPAPAILLWVLLFVGLAFTGSRAGLLAAVAGAGIQGLLVAAWARHWRPGTLAVAAVALGLAAVVAIGVEQGLGRVLATSRYLLTWNDRIEMYRATLALWPRFPLLGTGLGTFRDAFPLEQVAPRDTMPWHAHNDWLELVATTGVVGTLVVVAGLVVLVRAMLHRLDERLRSEDRAAALAAVGALASVGLHSLVDFGLTMPANAVALAILVGAALGVQRPPATGDPARA